MCKKWYAPDILLVNGDCIEGRQDRQGGAELLTNDRNVQSEMAAYCVREWGAKKILMTYGCLTAGHRILTKDLRWIPVEQLKVGDKLLAFEETGKGRLRRKWIESEVVENTPFIDEVYRIDLSDGTYLEANAKHPFLVKTTSRVYWKTVKQLYESINKNGRGWLSFQRVVPVWNENENYETGYLSGFFDGEGSLDQIPKKRRTGHDERTLRVSGCQKEGIVLDYVQTLLKNEGYDYSVYRDYKDKKICNIQLKGGFAGILKFLGSIRPRRLLNKFDIEKLGSIRSSFKDNTRIIKITPIGKKIVHGLGTTSSTYVSEGFLSHNTKYHVGDQAEDFEYVIAKDIGAKIEGRLFFEVEGMTIDARHKVGSSSIPHGRATSLLRDMMWNLVKSTEDEEPRAQIIIRSHVHYNIWVEQPNRVMFTTPALQLSRGRFGSRECVGETHWGAIRLKIDNGQIVGRDINIWNLHANKPRVIRIK